MLARKERTETFSDKDYFTLPEKRVTPKRGTERRWKPNSNLSAEINRGTPLQHSAPAFSSTPSPDSLVGNARDLQ